MDAKTAYETLSWLSSALGMVRTIIIQTSLKGGVAGTTEWCHPAMDLLVQDGNS